MLSADIVGIWEGGRLLSGRLLLRCLQSRIHLFGWMKLAAISAEFIAAAARTIGDGSGHGRTPVNPSNRFPSPITVQIGCLQCADGIRPLYWMSGNCIAITDPAFRPRAPLSSTLALADYGVPENVFNQVVRLERTRRASLDTTLLMLFAARARLHRSMPSHCSRGLFLW